MPGNIRVAVLEAVDLPATVNAGTYVSVRVAVGKREFQTILAEAQDGRTQPWNSEFLFPVLNLRDNVMVAIMDSKGEMVAKAELETPGIVQKGFQDAFVALKAQGRIHVKVSFVLSEEERKKIESMRATSMKKRKGFGNPRQQQQQKQVVSNVKITEITSEDSSVPSVATAESTTVPKEKSNGSRPTCASESSGTISTSEEPISPVKDEVTSQKSGVEKKIIPEKNLKPDNDNKRKGFGWFKPLESEVTPRQTAQAAAEGSRWLEGLKTKTKSEQVRSNRADEWIKAQHKQPEPRVRVPGETSQREKLQSLRKDEDKGRKSVKQRLEEWKLKELGPWRRSTSRVRHATSPGVDPSSGGKKIGWVTRKSKVEKEPMDNQGLAATKEELMAAADNMWASTLNHLPPSQSSTVFERERKRPGGLKGAVKQVLSGVGSVLWPGKKKQERYHIVKEGETLSSIVPEEWDNPDSNFFRLNPRVRDSGLVYPGQRLRLH